MNPENPPVSSEITPPAPQNKKNKVLGIIKEIVIFAVIAFGIVLPFRMYIAEPYLVDGRSMDPTFATGDYLIVDKFSYRNKGPERNTVLVFKYPNNPSKSFIKRVIGLPGETVVIKNGEVTIINSENPNGFLLGGGYVTHKCPAVDSCIQNFQKTLSGDEYFVMGDNRAESFDSRYWGPLEKKYILGKPILRLFPIDEIGVNPGALK
jgi:signal peptidase I